MQDEPSSDRVHRNKPSDKPFLREQRLVTVRAVQRPSLDSAAQWGLCIALAEVIPGVDRAAIQEARKKCESPVPVLDKNPDLRAAFERTEAVARMYLSRLGWGWNKLPEQHDRTEKALVRVKKLLERIAKHRNQTLVKAKAATKLMALVGSGSQLEHRLFEAGWPLNWPDEVMPRARALVPGVDAALAELANDNPDTGAGFPKPRPGAPTQFAEHEAFAELADVWESLTDKRPSRCLAEHDGTSSYFAEFFGAVLEAVRPGISIDGVWWVQTMAKHEREAERD